MRESLNDLLYGRCLAVVGTPDGYSYLCKCQQKARDEGKPFTKWPVPDWTRRYLVKP